MRKHSARKWLHFVLDLLPILVLPIFAIYEINHDHNTPITFTDGAWEYQTMYQTNDVNTWNDLVENNIYEIDAITLSTDVFYDAHCSDYIEGNLLYFEGNEDFTIYSDTFVSIYDYNSNELNYIYFYIDSNSMQLYLSNEMAYAQINDASVQITLNNCVIQLTTINQDLNDYITYLNQTFSSTDFNVIEYVYNENHVYDNTDIGSQMLYALYKPVKDYFNFNNVFNFGDIYHWFELNMFNGNAPMPIFIVWNIIVYQFLMDLIFLIYSIFMFIIDFSTEVLGRAFDFSRHGGCK